MNYQIHYRKINTIHFLNLTIILKIMKINKLSKEKNITSSKFLVAAGCCSSCSSCSCFGDALDAIDDFNQTVEDLQNK
jgi:hypothetical protein